MSLASLCAEGLLSKSTIGLLTILDLSAYGFYMRRRVLRMVDWYDLCDCHVSYRDSWLLLVFHVVSRSYLL